MRDGLGSDRSKSIKGLNPLWFQGARLHNLYRSAYLLPAGASWATILLLT